MSFGESFWRNPLFFSLQCCILFMLSMVPRNSSTIWFLHFTINKYHDIQIKLELTLYQLLNGSIWGITESFHITSKNNRILQPYQWDAPSSFVLGSLLHFQILWSPRFLSKRVTQNSSIITFLFDPSSIIFTLNVSYIDLGHGWWEWTFKSWIGILT